jgi:hypothetical protein
LEEEAALANWKKVNGSFEVVVERALEVSLIAAASPWLPYQCLTVVGAWHEAVEVLPAWREALTPGELPKSPLRLRDEAMDSQAGHLASLSRRVERLRLTLRARSGHIATHPASLSNASPSSVSVPVLSR